MEPKGDDLQVTLEYSGPYEGNWVGCEDCAHWKTVDSGDLHRHGTCKILSEKFPHVGLRICHANNICRRFKKRITHPNYRPFDYDEYYEWLMNDYYRPYGIDRDKPPVGKMNVGGKEYDLPATRDLPWCIVKPPDCTVLVSGAIFRIDSRKYRDHSFIDDDGYVHYVSYQYKEKSRSRKNIKLIYGKVHFRDIKNCEGDSK